jgi:iron-sulfur cluster assembly accessory protein
MRVQSDEWLALSVSWATMIKFTSNALNKLQSVKPPVDIAKYLRLGVIGGGCSGYSYSMTWADKKEPLDRLFIFTELDVIVDPVSLMYLDGMTVGFAETTMQSGFTFDNPNAKKTCGCGSSFEAK